MVDEGLRQRGTKARKLQNPQNGREIMADAALQKVFGKTTVTMFEMNKHLARDLK